MTNYNGNWHKRFLDALARRGVVAPACRDAGVSRSAVTAACKNDADFAAAFDDAMEEAIDRAEAEAWRRGVEGYDKPVVYQGEITDTYKAFSDDLLKTILQGRRKHVFANRTELTGADGAPLQDMDEGARAARIAQILAAAQQRKADGEAGDDPEDDVSDLA